MVTRTKERAQIAFLDGSAFGCSLPVTTVCFWPRLCKNVFQREGYSNAKSTFADVPINFRFNVDAHTSILAKRFYTLRPHGSRSHRAITRSIQVSMHTPHLRTSGCNRTSHLPAGAGWLAGDALEGATEGRLRGVAQALRYGLNRQSLET